jgi:ATP-binding cassette subfamily B protein
MPTTYDLLKRLVSEHGREYAPQYAVVIVCMLPTWLGAYVLKCGIDAFLYIKKPPLCLA